jgi:hypothetical protein
MQSENRLMKLSLMTTFNWLGYAALTERKMISIMDYEGQKMVCFKLQSQKLFAASNDN